MQSTRDAAAQTADGGNKPEPSDSDAGSTVPGPGIGDANGEVFCLAEQADLNVAFYFGVQKHCFIWDKKEGDFLDAEKANFEALCTSNYSGTVVTACPADERVAYCAGNSIYGAGMVNETHVVYKSAVNPDAASVARDSAAVCQTLPGFDLDDRMLSAACKGKLSAEIDGKILDFSAQLTCLVKVDGTRTSFFVRGTTDVNSADSKELSLYFLKTGDKVELKNELGQPGYGYLEGATAAGAFSQPITGSMPAAMLDTFEADGSALAGSFELGSLGKSASSTGADARAISGGKIDLTFEIQ